MSSGFISRPQQHNYASALRLSFPFVSRNRQLTFALPPFLPAFYLATSFHPSSMSPSPSLSLSLSFPPPFVGVVAGREPSGCWQSKRQLLQALNEVLVEKTRKRRKEERCSEEQLITSASYYIIYTYTRRPLSCLHSFFLGTTNHGTGQC